MSYLRIFTPILYLQPSSSQSDLQQFHFNFSGFFYHFFAASAMVLSRRFLPAGVFYPTLLYVFVTFCDSDAGRNTPSMIFLCDCPLRVVPSGWRMVLDYWCLNYKDHWFINCPSEPESIESKLNYWICFACSKSYGKAIKTLWTRLDKKYCLKPLP